MSYQNPSVSQFKIYFDRDFPFGNDPATQITDNDITKAMEYVAANINPALFISQEQYTIGFLLYSAHQLVWNIQNSSAGLSGQFDWLIASKGVGSVSVSSSIPSEVANNPMFAMLTRTQYGAQYLMMIYPMFTGNIFVVGGATLP